MADGKLNINITADASKVKQEMKSTTTSINNLENQTKKLESGFKSATIAIAATTAAIAGIVSASKELINTYSVQLIAETKLEATIKATGNQYGLSAEKLKAYASSLQSVTRFGDEAIIEAEALLVATQKLNEEGIQRTLTASADLAEALGTDIKSAAQTLAKVLQDPTKGLDRLKQSGISFTAQEKEQIEQLTEANKLFEAQALVLDKVEQAYGGMATSIAETDTGKLTQIANVFGDIKENLGESILNSISPALDKLLDALNKITEFQNRNKAVLETLGVDTEGTAAELWDRYVGKQEELGKWEAELESSKELRDFEASQTGFYDPATLTYISQVENTIEKLKAERAELGNAWYVQSKKEAETYVAPAPTTPAGSFSLNLPQSNPSSTLSLDMWADPLMRSLFNPDATTFTLAQMQGMGNLIGYTAPTKEPFSLSLSQTDPNAAYSEALAKSRTYADPMNWVSAGMGDQFNIGLFDMFSGQGLLDQEEIDKMLNMTHSAWDDIKDNIGQIGSMAYDTFKSVSTNLSKIWTDQANQVKAQMESMREQGTLTMEKEAELSKKMNDLNRKAFVAKQLNANAEATQAYALGMMNIWKEYAATPAVAGIMSGLLTASFGVQLASINSQQYTPFAKGGIVTGPTKALVGESGTEAIIPLNSNRAKNMMGTGLGNSLTVNITIEGNAREDDVYYAIERAQRTGLLPPWSH